MRTTTLGLSAALVALSGFAYACSSITTDAAFGEDSKNPTAGGSTAADAGGADFSPNAGTAPGDLAPVDNAVIMVHAAKSQSFRLCFKNFLDLRPQPDSQVMPNANVVGVEVGAAVRIGPLKGPPGDVLLFEEPLIRAYYPAFGGAGAGPSCNSLLENTSLGNLAVNLGNVGTDLSKGVHLLVVRGCPGNNLVRTFSTAECGADWSTPKGNLSVKEVTLSGARRDASSNVLPAQVINLSQPLDSERSGRNLVVSFGDLSGTDPLDPVVTNPMLFPDTNSQKGASSAQLALGSTDPAVYGMVGLRVTLEDAAGGGAVTKVFDETLASIQSQSSPRDVPPTYYAAASNYALLLLGDPNAKLADGGPDVDARRNAHFLAVPVVDPADDAGAGGGGVDAGPTTGDAGTVPLP